MAAKGNSIKGKQARRRAKTHPMRKVAKELFLTGQFTLKEIADELKVSEPTMIKWKQEDKWEWEKGIRQNASKEIIAFLYEQILLLQQTCVDAKGKQRAMNAKEADTVVKISNSIEKLSYRLSASTAMEAFMLLGNEIKQSDPALAKQLLPFQTEILKRLA
jgi:hypothetical protein